MSTQELQSITGGFTPTLTCIFPITPWTPRIVAGVSPESRKHEDTLLHHVVGYLRP